MTTSATPGRIILTGSSGTLGSHVLRQLAGQPDFQVWAIHRKESPDPLQADNIRHEVIDFSAKEKLAHIFREFQPTAVVHCAAGGMIFPKVEWFKLIRFNLDFSLNLFEQAAAVGNCHFIHISTGLAYRRTGAPLTEKDALENTHPYGASKAAADILLRSAALEFNLPLTLFRPFSFTGSNDQPTRLFPSLLRAAAENQPLALSPGEQIRDFCSARDIAAAILLALRNPPPPQSPAIYNVGSGRGMKLRDLIGEVAAELALPVDLKFGKLPYTPFEPMHLVANIDHAQSGLNWSPRHNLAHAVWELARASFPALKLKEPREHFAP